LKNKLRPDLVGQVLESNIDYEVILLRKGGKIYGRIPELAIIEVAEDVNALLMRIDERKKELIDRFNEAGLEDEIPMPESGEREAFERDTYRFLIRAIVVTCAVIVSLYVLGAQLHEAGSHFVRSIKDEINFPGTLEELAGNLENMPKEKREKLHKTLQEVTEQLNPFVQDVRPLLENSGGAECAGHARELQGGVNKKFSQKSS
jgi:hypothetical protein